MDFIPIFVTEKVPANDFFIKNNKYTVVIFLSLFSSRLVFSIEPEDLLVSDALSKPCLSGSVQEADLMSCVSKGYILAQKKLNLNYDEFHSNFRKFHRFE